MPSLGLILLGVLIGATAIAGLHELRPPTLPSCAVEDADNCVWDASARGNGRGQDFIAYGGRVYYPGTDTFHP